MIWKSLIWSDLSWSLLSHIKMYAQWKPIILFTLFYHSHTFFFIYNYILSLSWPVYASIIFHSRSMIFISYMANWLWAIAAPSSQHSMGHFSVVFVKTKIFYGFLIFVWGIYTELQNCMYQTAHGPCLSQSLGKWTNKFAMLSGTDKAKKKMCGSDRPSHFLCQKK
jgi:hypothetical protein